MEISAIAAREDRVIVTADYDFGEIALRDQHSVPGIVILAPTTALIEDRAQRLVAIVSARGDALREALTVVEDGRLRVRSLKLE